MDIQKFTLQPFNSLKTINPLNNHSKVEINFRDVLKQLKNESKSLSRSENKLPTTTQNNLTEIINNYVNLWTASEQKLRSQLKNINPESKKIIELQIEINKFNLKTLIATQCAEACSGTVKRVQQMGAN